MKIATFILAAVLAFTTASAVAQTRFGVEINLPYGSIYVTQGEYLYRDRDYNRFVIRGNQRCYFDYHFRIVRCDRGYHRGWYKRYDRYDRWERNDRRDRWDRRDRHYRDRFHNRH